MLSVGSWNSTTETHLLKVDVDEAEGIDEEFNISGLPTFVFLKKGEKVANLIGNNVEKLRDLVNKLENFKCEEKKKDTIYI